MKNWTHYTLKGTMIIMILAVIVGIGSTVYSSNQWTKENDALHDRMRVEQCKVTAFVPSRWQVRPVWTCPDGHAEIGQPQ